MNFFSIFYYKIKENILIQIMQDSLSLCHRPPFVSLFLANSEKHRQLRCHVGFCDEVAWNKGSKRNGGIIASLCFISLLNYVLFFRLIVWWMSPSGTHHFLFLIRTNTSFDLKVKGKLYPILYFHICLWIKLIFSLTSSKKFHLFKGYFQIAIIFKMTITKKLLWYKGYFQIPNFVDDSCPFRGTPNIN